MVSRRPTKRLSSNGQGAMFMSSTAPSATSKSPDPPTWNSPVFTSTRSAAQSEAPSPVSTRWIHASRSAHNPILDGDDALGGASLEDGFAARLSPRSVRQQRGTRVADGKQEYPQCASNRISDSDSHRGRKTGLERKVPDVRFKRSGAEDRPRP